METERTFFIASTSQSLLSAPGKGTVFDEKPSRLYRLITAAIAHKGSIQNLAQRLIRLCELAYGHRDIKSLEEASRALWNLPSRSAREFGQYYQAIAAHRRGQTIAALSQLEELTECRTSSAYTRAAQTIASISYEIGDYERAARLHKSIMAGSSDGVALAGVLFNTSAIASVAGDHRQALAVLARAWPIIKNACQQQPHLWPLYNNEVAFELLQLGQVEQAAKYSRVATSSPIIDAYPEWRETREQIIERQSAPVTISVSVPPISSQETAEHQEPVSLSSPIEDKPLTCTRNVAPTANLIYERVIRSHPPTGPPAALGAK